ncbi:MAG: hypothetical protein RL539_1405, partial [Pseudomonadota bacterium]
MPQLAFSRGQGSLQAMIEAKSLLLGCAGVVAPASTLMQVFCGNSRFNGASMQTNRRKNGLLR